jgi:hypothetical protein
LATPHQWDIFISKFGTFLLRFTVGDGAPWVANQMALRFGEAGYYLIDFYHLCEYLAAAAKRCDADSRAWLAQQRKNA